MGRCSFLVKKLLMSDDCVDYHDNSIFLDASKPFISICYIYCELDRTRHEERRLATRLQLSVLGIQPCFCLGACRRRALANTATLKTARYCSNHRGRGLWIPSDMQRVPFLLRIGYGSVETGQRNEYHTMTTAVPAQKSPHQHQHAGSI